MSRDRDESTVIQVEKPRLQRGRPHCPRCEARLLYDGEELLCLACGYEYSPSDRELAQYRSSWRRAAAIAGIAPGVALGIPLGVAGAAVAAAVGIVVLLMGLRGWHRR